MKSEETPDITWTVRNNLCYSCGLCDFICPKNAISFGLTNIGRLEPSIDYGKCNGCALCLKMCPGLDHGNLVLNALADIQDPFTGTALSCHIGIASDREIYINAQSGGLVTQTLRYLFDTGLITHAAVVSMQFGTPPSPVALIATSPAQLFEAQKSTYVPINLLSALKSLRQSENLSIALVGLPCHMEAVLSLKTTNNEAHHINYKLGLICDGILTHIALSYFGKRANIRRNVPYRIVFRDNSKFSYLDANVSIQTANGSQRLISKEERFILKKFLTPPRCLICFNKMNLFADLVFGDPWHLKSTIPERGKGVVISRTDRGYQLIVDLMKKGHANLSPIRYADILKGQHIEMKKQRVASGLTDYKSLNLCLPHYFAHPLEEHLKTSLPPWHHSNRVAKFLATEQKHVDCIIDGLVKEVKRRLFFRSMKGKVTSFIRMLTR